MMEVAFDGDDGASTQRIENQGGLSAIDYNTQVVFTLFFGGLGINDFNAGNNGQGLAKLVACLFPPLMLIIVLVSLIQLSQGDYTDADGKAIRQVVQLKKEEMSSVDHKTAMILCSFLGVLGIHQFYSGKTLEGVLMLCTFGGFGVWTAINLYQLATCSFKDGQGKTICPDYIKLSR